MKLVDWLTAGLSHLTQRGRDDPRLLQPSTAPQQRITPLTPNDVQLVQESFKLRPISAQTADFFYGRLFEIAPEVRPLFPEDLSEQKKKLMGMLTTVVTNLHQVEKILSAAQDLGRRHISYGVTAAHYEPVGEALIWTLDRGLGEAFTPQVKSAWIAAYTTLASVMREATTSATRA